ncbi:MAG: flagellar filament capping protein FliD [Terracidiphilus sp.]
MGTVGLSFGSPTSGAGFNVSSTVAEIVGNLQNVETPWKTQMTSLENQDKAISSLGTLFSNLSNDLSSLTDLEGILSQKTGSSSDTNVLTLTSANNTAIAGTHTVTVTNLASTSSGYLAPITNASNKLSGSVTLQAGSGAAHTITVNSSDNTLSGLASAINTSGVGITASVLTDASGSRLSLVSGTSGANGNVTISSNSIAASDQILDYTGTAGSTGVASTGTLTGITNAGDTLSGSISIQVGNGTAQTVTVGTTSNTLSTLAGAINTADTAVTASVVTNNDGSSSLQIVSNTTGTAGTLTVTSSIVDTGATTLGYTSTVTGKDANLTVDGINLTSASNTVANLIPGITFQLLAPSATETGGGLEQVQVVIGNDNTDVESTVNQMVNDYNSLISAMNTQEGNDSSGIPEPLFGSPTLSLLQQQLMNGINAPNPNGTLTSISTSTNTTLAGSISITVGSGAPQTITLTSNNTISGLASAINAVNIGVTAGVVTSDGQSTLALTSQTAGPSGGLTVSSSIVATGYTPLSYSGADATSTENSTGALTGIPSSTSDVLTGSIAIQVGSGTAETVVVGAAPSSPAANTIYTGSGINTLSQLAGAINTANIGVTASVVTNGNGSQSLSLLSKTAGNAGNLSVTSSLMDTTSLTSKTLSYTNSSDINSMTSLGISVNNDGSLTFDATALDSVLNSDYSSVAGFFQNADSWGQTFSTMLTNAGASTPTGILALASSSNSNIESTLNADISKENSYISAQQASLTTELNQANQIMQQLPTQLEGINELYSAITGYDQNVNG